MEELCDSKRTSHHGCDNGQNQIHLSEPPNTPKMDVVVHVSYQEDAGGPTEIQKQHGSMRKERMQSGDSSGDVHRSSGGMLTNSGDIQPAESGHTSGASAGRDELNVGSGESGESGGSGEHDDIMIQ